VPCIASLPVLQATWALSIHSVLKSLVFHTHWNNECPRKSCLQEKLQDFGPNIRLLQFHMQEPLIEL
jgi:hypothetical protein